LFLETSSFFPEFKPSVSLALRSAPLSRPCSTYHRSFHVPSLPSFALPCLALPHAFLCPCYTLLPSCFLLPWFYFIFILMNATFTPHPLFPFSHNIY
jgi:hypothetical protein